MSRFCGDSPQRAFLFPNVFSLICMRLKQCCLMLILSQLRRKLVFLYTCKLGIVTRFRRNIFELATIRLSSCYQSRLAWFKQVSVRLRDFLFNTVPGHFQDFSMTFWAYLFMEMLSTNSFLMLDLLNFEESKSQEFTGKSRKCILVDVQVSRYFGQKKELQRLCRGIPWIFRIGKILASIRTLQRCKSAIA